MSTLSKKIFLGIFITVPFLIYCFIYYAGIIKNAPFKFTEFDYVSLKYGTGDTLLNQYNSKTRIYQYLNKRDSLITTRVKLNKDDLLYLHRKAVQLGFWDYPEVLKPDNASPGLQVPRYYLEFKYKRKSKKLFFNADYNADTKLHDAAKTLIDEVLKTINDAEDRGNRK